MVNWLVSALMLEGNNGNVGALIKDGSEDATCVLMVPVAADSIGGEKEAETEELVART